MRELSQQGSRASNMGGVLGVVVLALPSLLAFLASMEIRRGRSASPGLWFCYEVLLTVGCGMEAVAIGLTGAAIYSGESSRRATLAMAGVTIAGALLSWYAIHP